MFVPALASNPFAIGGWVLVEPEVLETVDHFRQDTKDKPEAGGILLGFRRDQHLHVVEATAPTENDRRSRTSFKRAAEPHQRIAMNRWYASGGTMDYLGEWHTHPQSDPSPSGIDIAAWKYINELYPDRAFIFIIAGNVEHYWFGVARGLHLHRLPIAQSQIPAEMQ